MNVRTSWLVALILAMATSAAAQTPAANQRTVTVQYTAVPFHDAIQLLFQGTGLQYSIEPNVPNKPVTLSLRDIPLDSALGSIVRATGVENLVVQRRGEFYTLKLATPGVADADLTLEKISIQYQRADHIQRRLENTSVPGFHAGEPGQGPSLMPAGISSIHSSITDNSLLVRGTLDGIEALKNLVRLIDVPERTLVLTVGVTGPGLGVRELRIQSSARTLNGRNVTIDEEVPAGPQRSKLKVRLEPFMRGDGAIHIDADWDVSVSVPGAKGEAIRLVKRFQSSTAMQPGVGVAVSTVDLGTWGGSGQVRFWLRGQTISGQWRSLETSAGEKFPDYVRLLGGVPYLPVETFIFNQAGELVRGPRGYELVALEQQPPSGIIGKAARNKVAGPFSITVGGRPVSARLIFLAQQEGGGELMANPFGEPYIPLEDVAKAIGGKLEFDPLSDTYRIVGGSSLGSLLGSRSAGR